MLKNITPKSLEALLVVGAGDLGRNIGHEIVCYKFSAVWKLAAGNLNRRCNMRLFQVNYLENNNIGCYLTVGTNEDTPKSIEKRERERNDWDCLYFLLATEVTEVDGHKIIVE